MAFPLDMYSITWTFKLNRVGIDQDIAEFRLFYKTDGGAQYGDNELLDVAQGGWDAWHDHVSPLGYCDNVVLGYTTATSYLANGHTFAVQQYDSGPEWVGTANPPSLPWETSLCVSIYTYPRGSFVSDAKRKRGRFYTPVNAAAALDHSNSGYYQDATIGAKLLEMKAFLEASQNDSEGAQVGHLGVFSRMDGVIRAVTEVSLDAKFDSQRRRQNRETAAYIKTAF